MSDQNDLVKEIRTLIKEIREERRENNQDVEQEAKEILAHYIESARAQFDPSFEAPEDEPRELDDQDPKDKRIIKLMSKLTDSVLDELIGDDEESEDENEEDEEDDG